MSTVYDDPVNTARRLLTIHKDQPWARGELADLVPLLLDEIDRLYESLDDIAEKMR